MHVKLWIQYIHREKLYKFSYDFLETGAKNDGSPADSSIH